MNENGAELNNQLLLNQAIKDLDRFLLTYKCSNDLTYLNNFFAGVERLQNEIKRLKGELNDG